MQTHMQAHTHRKPTRGEVEGGARRLVGHRHQQHHVGGKQLDGERALDLHSRAVWRCMTMHGQCLVKCAPRHNRRRQGGGSGGQNAAASAAQKQRGRLVDCKACLPRRTNSQPLLALTVTSSRVRPCSVMSATALKGSVMPSAGQQRIRVWQSCVPNGMWSAAAMSANTMGQHGVCAAALHRAAAATLCTCWQASAAVPIAAPSKCSAHLCSGTSSARTRRLAAQRTPPEE